MMTTQEKVEEVYKALQDLDIKATPNNTSIMAGVYKVLKEIYKETGAVNDGRAESDPE